MLCLCSIRHNVVLFDQEGTFSDFGVSKHDRTPWWAVSSAIIARKNESTPEKK